MPLLSRGPIRDVKPWHDVEPAAGGCRYRRTLVHPARPKAPTEDMIRRIDEEAAVSLQNIRRAVEARRGGSKG